MSLRLKLKAKESKQPPPQEQQDNEEFKIQFIFSENGGKQQFNLEQQFKYLIQKRNQKEVMIIQKDFIYIGEAVAQKMDGFGKIYIKQYDAYCNNSYFVYEGSFQNDQIEGKGTEFYGKTNKKKAEGIFHKLAMVEKIQEYNEDGTIVQKQQQQLQQSMIQDDRGNKGFRIKSAIKQTPQQPKTQTKANDKWSKYDVELSKDDLSSLLAEKAIGDSIMEAYLNYINFANSEQFFSLQSVKDIQQFKRSIVLPYFLFEEKKIKLLDYFVEYNYLNGQFWMIYSRIFFIINSNGHWLIIEMNMEGQDVKMKVYDSQSKKKAIFYVTMCKHVWTQVEAIVKCFNLTIQWKSKDIIVVECPQLSAPNDSGVYTCAYLKYLINNQPLESIHQEIVNNMRKNELFNIIKREK